MTSYTREIIEINRFILLNAPFVGRQRYYTYTEAVNNLLHTNITDDELNVEYRKLREQLKSDDKLTSEIIKEQLIMSLDYIMCYSGTV